MSEYQASEIEKDSSQLHSSVNTVRPELFAVQRFHKLASKQHAVVMEATFPIAIAVPSQKPDTNTINSIILQNFVIIKLLPKHWKDKINI